MATFLPSFYYSQFHVTKVQAGSLTVLATLTGSLTRVLGGWFADRVGGITILSVVFSVAIAGLFGLMIAPPLVATTLLFMLCFAALGGGILPNLLGQSKQHTGSYRAGFQLYAVFAVGVLVVMRVVARTWIHSWIAPGGRAIAASTHIPVASVGSRDRDIEKIPV